MATREEVQAAFELCAMVCEAVKEAGPIGLPSGHLYAALMGQGMSLDSYQSLISVVKRTGLVVESNHLLRWVGGS